MSNEYSIRSCEDGNMTDSTTTSVMTHIRANPKFGETLGKFLDGKRSTFRMVIWPFLPRKLETLAGNTNTMIVIVAQGDLSAVQNIHVALRGTRRTAQNSNDAGHTNHNPRRPSSPGYNTNFPSNKASQNSDGK